MRPTLAFDMEVYVNYTLLLFKDVESKRVWRFELPLDPLDMETMCTLIQTHRLITFNGTGYDIPLLCLVLRGDTSLQIKKASDRIIQQNLRWWNFEKEFNVKVSFPELDHVDLMEVAPLTGSLKLYGGRLHSRSIQDLPVAPSATISEEQKVVLRAYCENDCDTLIDLRNALKVQSDTGDEYGEARLYASIKQEAPKNSQAFVNFVGGTIDQFHLTTPQNDDITISTVKRLK